MSEESCEQCRFYSQGIQGDIPRGKTSGECRRRSPTMVVRDVAPEYYDRSWTNGKGTHEDEDREGQLRRVWPLVYAFDWCGEYQPLTAPAPAVPLPPAEE